MSIQGNKIFSEIDKRLKDIEDYILEGKLLRTQIKDLLKEIYSRLESLEEVVHGEKNNDSDGGLVGRVRQLENMEKNREKNNDNFLKVAVGAITMTVGAFIIWVFKLIWWSK